jgi:hypothetical protein
MTPASPETELQVADTLQVTVRRQNPSLSPDPDHWQPGARGSGAQEIPRYGEPTRHDQMMTEPGAQIPSTMIESSSES